MTAKKNATPKVTRASMLATLAGLAPAYRADTEATMFLTQTLAQAKEHEAQARAAAIEAGLLPGADGQPAPLAGSNEQARKHAEAVYLAKHAGYQQALRRTKELDANLRQAEARVDADRFALRCYEAMTSLLAGPATR